ncbi:MAG TPA: hypothetical protein VF740_14605 [Candidatus Acidoferrum sp.]
MRSRFCFPAQPRRVLPHALLACFSLGTITTAIYAANEGSQLTYFGAWPHQIVVFDAGQEKVVGTINLKNDVPRYLILSSDKKKLFVWTVNDNSIVTIDLTTRAVVSSFSLNHGNQNVRLIGFAPDPTGKYLYSLGRIISKQRDHYDLDPPAFFVIDLAAQKITRSGEYPKDEGTLPPRAAIKVSPDGKLLYLFRQSILVFDTKDFHLVKKVDLAKPQGPGLENISLGIIDDPNETPGRVVSVFSAADPYVHREVFGIGDVDLTNLSFNFSPVAPSTAASDFHALFLTPDRKIGYTVAFHGGTGNARCEFWAFDMATRRLLRKREFDGRTRFYFGLSADGTKIFIYGAGYQIEVYDAATFELRTSVEVPGDVTTNMVVLPLNSVAALSADGHASTPMH